MKLLHNAGFSILNATADSGAGIYIENASPTIKSCQIVQCVVRADPRALLLAYCVLFCTADLLL